MYANHESFRSFISGPDVTRIVVGFLIAHILTNFIIKVKIGNQIENKTFDFEKVIKQLLWVMLEMYGIYIFYKMIMYIRPHEKSELYLKKK